jgi:hypothetical protein
MGKTAPGRVGTEHCPVGEGAMVENLPDFDPTLLLRVWPQGVGMGVNSLLKTVN